MSSVDKWSLGRVRLNSGGYDARGQYFGLGAPLYRFYAPDGRVDEVRASSREEAKSKIRFMFGARYPEGIEFYR